ncbi:MAG: hypothetical protein RBT63_11700 [Bdellovibrionales bacterium]|nr:hypothetical protein [Bdellovibrionales bacterium]
MEIMPRDYPDLKHKVHLVRGHRALSDGDVSLAENELLLACGYPGRVLSSFGPNMTLAKRLLVRGHSSAVLEFIDRCSLHWGRGDETVLKWRSDIRAGKVPDFGANLDY